MLERGSRSEEHTSELQSQPNLVCRLLLEKKKARARSVRQALGIRQPDVSARPRQPGPLARPVRSTDPELRAVFHVAISPGLAARDRAGVSSAVRRLGAARGAAPLARRSPGGRRHDDADTDPLRRARLLSQLQVGLFASLRRTGAGARGARA